MSKRFTDSDKWKKAWYRGLSNDHKVFWQFLLDHCNHAGIWEVDFSFAEIFCGKLDETAVRAAFKKQYQELANGKKWFVVDFIQFQYGELTPTNRLHASVLKILEKEGAYKPLKSPLLGAKDKDKEKDKEAFRGGGKGEGKDGPGVVAKNDAKEKHLDYVLLTKDEHAKIMERLGPDLARRYIDRLNNYIGSSGARYKSHYHTILSWASKDADLPTTEKKGGRNAKDSGTNPERDRRAEHLDALGSEITV